VTVLPDDEDQVREVLRALAAVRTHVPTIEPESHGIRCASTGCASPGSASPGSERPGSDRPGSQSRAGWPCSRWLWGWAVLVRHHLLDPLYVATIAGLFVGPQQAKTQELEPPALRLVPGPGPTPGTPPGTTPDGEPPGR
jgi:hypothetical protein